MSLFSGMTLGFIGAGNMAEALGRGLLDAGLIAPAQIRASDPSAERRALWTAMGVAAGEDNLVPAACDVVVAAVKPQVFDAVLGASASALNERTLLVSIAAGIRTDRIARVAGGRARVVRVMPNTPLLVGAGAAGVAAGPRATRADLDLVLAMFRGAGVAEEVDESLLDAVTAVSGSGPAYLFRFTESLAKAAVAAGLPAELGAALARQTVVGAAKLLAESPEDPAELRRRVTSPGGTTAAALAVMEAEGFDRLLERAVLAARDRGAELSR